MSVTSVRSNEMMDPRYLKCVVKLMNELLGRCILWVIGEFQYSLLCCAWDMVLNVVFLVFFLVVRVLLSLSAVSSAGLSCVVGGCVG